MPGQPKQPQDDTSLVAIMREYITREEANRRFTEIERRIDDYHERTGEDVKEIKDDIKEIKDVRLVNLEQALINSQKEGMRRIIMIQSFILSPIALAVIGYLIKVIFHI